MIHYGFQIYKDLKKANFSILEDLCRRGRTRAREFITKKLQDTLLFSIFPPNRTHRSQSSSPYVSRNSIPPTFGALLLIGATLPLAISFQEN